jgi:uncharacterized membrane protein
MMDLLVIFWIGVLAVVAWLLKWPGSGRGRSRAEALLKERYARGELTHLEYERRIEELQR